MIFNFPLFYKKVKAIYHFNKKANRNHKKQEGNKIGSFPYFLPVALKINP
ncbi:hypothetical protein NEOC65_000277 [Neochlamydia sp. AcF65]|nr:hypothetical protein [Neochlamydia sp. AcF65]MBS4171186.1 hypothetical protein [Neochlamydia sp. AcF95]